MVTALLFSLSLSFVGGERAGALQLLDTTRCIVRVVLLSDCEKAGTLPVTQPETTREAPSEPQPSPSSPQSSASDDPSETAALSTSIVAPEPLSFDASGLQPIEFSANLVSWRQQVALAEKEPIANVAPVGTSDAAVLGVSEAVEPLRPSEHGWVLWGVAWYWWASLVAVVAVGVCMVNQTRLKQRLKVAGSS